MGLRRASGGNSLKTEGYLLAGGQGLTAKDAHAVDRVALLNAVNDYRAALVGKSTAPEQRTFSCAYQLGQTQRRQYKKRAIK